MSYRAFKRLLGETSLERKCRWLLGAGVLLLMTGSFWAYARQTEHLAYGQLETTGRALLSPIVAKWHVRGELYGAVDDFQKQLEGRWPDALKGYSAQLIQPDSTNPTTKAGPDDLPILHRIELEQKDEEFRQAP